MGDLAIRRPLSALRLLNDLLLPEAKDGDAIELEIHASSSGVAIRDMAAYLELIDHVYGRLHSGGYRSYVMRPREFVRIDEIRGGTIIIVIVGVVAAASPLLITHLCLKYLPAAAEKLANAYNSVEQGLLARQKRKSIRHEMEQDSLLSQMPKERRNELVTLVDSLLESEGELLVRAKRYAGECVIDLQIRLKK
jgi:hypothetical protein